MRHFLILLMAAAAFSQPRPQTNPLLNGNQPPGQVVIVWEFMHAYRIIPLDGRPIRAATGRPTRW